MCTCHRLPANQVTTVPAFVSVTPPDNFEETVGLWKPCLRQNQVFFNKTWCRFHPWLSQSKADIFLAVSSRVCVDRTVLVQRTPGTFPALFAATKSEYFSQEASPFPAVVLWKQKWRNINETFCGFTETSSSNIYSGDPVVSWRKTCFFSALDWIH